jgi:Protein of unknown function (DUF2442)
MSISATNVRFEPDIMVLELSDGRSLTVPLAWFPKLLRANHEQLAQVEISRLGLHWGNLNEDISVEGLLLGKRDQTNHHKVAAE